MTSKKKKHISLDRGAKVFLKNDDVNLSVETDTSLNEEELQSQILYQKMRLISAEIKVANKKKRSAFHRKRKGKFPFVKKTFKRKAETC